jgi:hypothetical protein
VSTACLPAWPAGLAGLPACLAGLPDGGDHSSHAAARLGTPLLLGPRSHQLPTHVPAACAARPVRDEALLQYKLAGQNSGHQSRRINVKLDGGYANLPDMQARAGAAPRLLAAPACDMSDVSATTLAWGSCWCPRAHAPPRPRVWFDACR